MEPYPTFRQHDFVEYYFWYISLLWVI